MNLNKLESELRKDVRVRARAARSISPKHTFFLTALVTPFAVVDALFVPFLGLALVLGALAISVMYLWATRSCTVAIAGVLGILCSVIALVALPSDNFFTQAPLLVYLMFGLCTAVTISYIFIVASALWSHYERGSERQPSGKVAPLA